MRTPWGDLVRSRLSMTPEDMFSAPVAARLLGVSSAKAYKEIASGRLPSVDLNSNVPGHPCYRLTKPDLLEYVKRIEINV